MILSKIKHTFYLAQYLFLNALFDALTGKVGDTFMAVIVQKIICMLV